MSHIATRAGPSTSAPTDGSRTIVSHDSQPREQRSDGTRSDDERGADGEGRPEGVLRLRGGPRSRQRVAWTEDVVDNEGMGKKKSKICCIFHKQRRFDESSSEEDSSDSDSDASSGSGPSCGENAHGRSHRHLSHRHRHPNVTDGEGAGEGQAPRDGGGSATVEELAASEPNAYERQPPVGKGKGDGGGRVPVQDH